MSEDCTDAGSLVLFRVLRDGPVCSDQSSPVSMCELRSRASPRRYAVKGVTAWASARRGEKVYSP